MGHNWDPARFTLGTSGPLHSEIDMPLTHLYAVILLNQPLEHSELVLSLAHRAVRTIFADGAANHFRDMALSRGMSGNRLFDLIPDDICGDFDSVRPEVADYYEQHGAELLKDSDQHSTDLMKCLKQASTMAKGHLAWFNEDHAKWPKVTSMDVVILGGLGGRADQAFSQLHHLYVASNDPTLNLGEIYLVTPSSIIFLLKKGLNWIRAPVAPGFFTENVGIIPMGRPSVISTQGLEWDVTNWSTEFGTQLSTSNHIKADVVRVTTTEKVLFTMELADVKKPHKETPERGVKRVKKENEAPRHP